MSEKLFIAYGAGSDQVGLVEKITSGIAQAGGNITDLRQDSLHGLFTVYLVADLNGTSLRKEQFDELIRNIGEDTGLALHAERFVPLARNAQARNLLLILLGKDRPGIVSRVSQDLSSHHINIEFSRMVAREGVFLMELLTDISQSTLPPENLESFVREHMAAVGIATMFQSKDVFNPKKRIILFDIAGSLIAPETLQEVLQQSGMSRDSLPDSPAAAARLLEGMPAEVFHKLVASLGVSADSLELVHSLKRMGYRTALSTTAFSPVTEALKERLGLDHAFGLELPIDDDSQTLIGDASEPCPREQVLARLQATEGVANQDVSVIETQGLGVEFNMRLALDFLNQRVLSRQTLAGILGSLGAL